MLFRKVIYCLFAISSGFNPTIRSMANIVKRKINDDSVLTYELENINKKETPCVLFFTGLNSLIPGDVYEELLTKLSLQGISTYVAESNVDSTNDLVDDLVENYANVTIVGHSSGCINGLIASNANKEIKSVVLMDPVDNSMFFQDIRGKTLTLKYVENLMFLNAAKSYKWELSPTSFSVPFIPGFKINEKNLKLKKGEYKFLEAVDFGHSDILDEPWSDVMLNSISKGSNDRDNTVLSEYKFWVSSRIKHFI